MDSAGPSKLRKKDNPLGDSTSVFDTVIQNKAYKLQLLLITINRALKENLKVKLIKVEEEIVMRAFDISRSLHFQFVITINYKKHIKRKLDRYCSFFNKCNFDSILPPPIYIVSTNSNFDGLKRITNPSEILAKVFTFENTDYCNFYELKDIPFEMNRIEESNINDNITTICKSLIIFHLDITDKDVFNNLVRREIGEHFNFIHTESLIDTILESLLEHDFSQQDQNLLQILRGEINRKEHILFKFNEMLESFIWYSAKIQSTETFSNIINYIQTEALPSLIKELTETDEFTKLLCNMIELEEIPKFIRLLNIINNNKAVIRRFLGRIGETMNIDNLLDYILKCSFDNNHCLQKDAIKWFTENLYKEVPPNQLENILDHSITCGNTDMFDFFINKYSGKHRNYFKYSLKTGNPRAIEYLLDKHKNDIIDNGNSILHIACQIKDINTAIIDLLLEKLDTNNIINARNNNDEPPIFTAIRTGQPLKVIQHLRDKGAIFNIQNRHGQCILNLISEKVYDYEQLQHINTYCMQQLNPDKLD